MQLPTRKLLVYDGLAALLATMLILSLLAYLPGWLQLPVKLFYLLPCISAVYAVYAFSVSRKRNIQRWQLRLLAIGNALYGLFCVGLMIYFYPTTNLLGLAYLSIDTAIVTALALVEWQHSHQLKNE